MTEAERTLDQSYLGLTEEHGTRLAEYQQKYAAAKAIADEYKRIVDELEKIEHAARGRAYRVRNKVASATRPPTAMAEPQRERCDFPKQAIDMVNRRSDRISSKSNPESPSDEVLRDRYLLVRSINAFAFWHGMTRAEALRRLKVAGIDVMDDVAREWEKGVNLRELSRRHGAGRDTIARWIKKTGQKVPPRNSRQRYSEDVIIRTFQTNESCNEAAKRAGVSWATARRVIQKAGLWKTQSATKCVKGDLEDRPSAQL